MTITDSPFALLTDPQAVFAALEYSDRLNNLERRICRPLDDRWIGVVCGDAVASFDEAIDAADDLDD